MIAPGYINTAINRSVGTKLKADLDSGVNALVKAIDNEKVGAGPDLAVATDRRSPTPPPQSVTRHSAEPARQGQYASPTAISPENFVRLGGRGGGGTSGPGYRWTNLFGAQGVRGR